MKKIYEMIENPLTDENLKNIVSIIEQNNIYDKSLYEILKISNSPQVANNSYKTFLKKLFMQNVYKILNCDRVQIENVGDKKLLEDYDLLMASRNILENMSIDELFKSDIFLKLNYKNVYPQSESLGYIHIHNLIPNQEKIECRIYMCPSVENISEICDLIIQKHDKYNIPCYFKINTNFEENDRIVLYSSFENFELHCKIFEEIQSEKPELFENCEKNILWSNIKNYQNIYFGGEPYYTGYQSYGSRLSDVISSAYCDFKYLNNVSGNLENITQFREFLNYKFLKNNINPSNPSFNYSKEFANSCDDAILYLEYDSKRIPIYIVPSISNNEICISKDPLFFTSFNISKEDFLLLYKKNPDDVDYARSEDFRMKVFNKLLKLEEEYNNREKTELYQTR